ncbi:unnamed protein product [Sphenostylis stenocarpa]|uniref:FAD-binding PCMH-type domain-containing protein n=1 Tax=Sphenostylis stenocarpa TaxID=92480 RepID=A0AA86VZC3_9FABA|nr:unnamed protein product [Sphenostylis stenocarpa]
MAKPCLVYLSAAFLLLTVATSLAPPYSNSSLYHTFLHCLTQHTNSSTQLSNIVFAPTDPSFPTVLQNHVRNARFNNSQIRKPLLIVTPLQESHVQGAVICAKTANVILKIRSGGHDYEGISYVSKEPFIILDMFNLRTITVDITNDVAVVQTGATLGEIYYRIWEKSKVHGFPAGVCPTVGVGGTISAGGYGNMLRKYGLSVDNVIDAQIVDVKGNLLNRKSMGEDLFWGIRGGGGASFGVVLSFTIKLVSVPETVTVFRVEKTLETNVTATDLVVQWQQVAPTTDDRLFMRLLLEPVTSNVVKGGQTIRASVLALFLGGADEVVSILEKEFPLLGLKKENCIEVSWIDSVLWWKDGQSLKNGDKPETLLDRNLNSADFLKRKSDYVQKAISKDELEGIFKTMIELGNIGFAFNPYGGKMGEIPADATPFPHRKGNLFKVQYFVTWHDPSPDAAQKFMNEARRLYNYMTPFVSKNPRSAFLAYRDLDIGVNNFGNNSFEEGEVYGTKYFNDNFDRLVNIKTKVDPDNFFRNEQSIPVRPSKAFQVCPTVGVGGHFCGGGYGNMMRKYGLSIDHSIDAQIVDVKEDFGQNATDLVVQWQKVAPHTDERLFMRLELHPVNSNVGGKHETIRAEVVTLFLGGADELVSLLEKEFPILGLNKDNCIEMSWIESALWWASFRNGTHPNALLNRKLNSAKFLKRSDYVKTPISQDELEWIWKRMI